MQITVYSKSGCPQCMFTKKFLEAEQIAFTEKRVDIDPVSLEEVREMGYSSLPVVTDGKGNSFTGYQPDMLESLVE